MTWNLYNNNTFLEPIEFSNGKTQEDVVNEVIKLIKEGNKIIFIKGACGSGKSAVALNIAKELGKTSIVVPIKGLQKQYEEDYTNKLYVLKDGKKLKITVIDGRNNHKCLYNNTFADNKELPCTIEIKEKNFKILMKYLRHPEELESIDDINRRSIANICPHWSPIIPEEMDYNLKDAEILSYKGLKNTKFNFYKRKLGCSYYDQFNSYINSDIIVFNSKKYELENLMNRKPETEIEIIDECDYFLDNLSNEKIINLNKLSLRISNIPKKEELVQEINNLINEIRKLTTEPILIKKTKVNELLKIFQTTSLTEDNEDYDYLDRIQEIAKYFENILDETYVSLEKDILSIVTINLEKKLNELLDKNKVFVMMSGTIHSEEVLRNIFGIKDFKTVEAETKFKGQVHKIYTELEENFNYEFSKNNRGLYLKALSKCIEIANKPALVYVKAYNDLPTIQECIDYGITNIKTREDLIEEQETFRRGELIQNFKDKQHKILYSTKCSRGVDFPGDICNSIIFTKYPYPNINSLFWKVLKKEKPNAFNSFYYEKAKRDLIQIIYRGVRSEDDEVDILSPDIRVFK